MGKNMSGYVSMKHDPPQVLTVVAITCRQCGGSEMYTTEADGPCACRICENGYEKVLVPVAELVALLYRFGNFPSDMHAHVVEMAERDNVRLPVLTHCTDQLAPHLCPTKPRLQSRNAAD